MIQLYKRLVAKLQSLPGVRSVALSGIIPMTGDDWSYSFTIIGHASLPVQDHPSVQYRVASGDYFRALRVPLIEGRLLGDQDDLNAPPSVLINEAMAKRYFPGEDPVGKEIVFDNNRHVSRRVVGVVGNTRESNLETEGAAIVYVPVWQDPWHYMGVLVRTESDPSALMTPIRSIVHSVDPELPVYDMEMMSDIVHRSAGDRRFITFALTLFALVALTLALIGLYGLITYSVTQRSQEIAIRMAVGARREQVLALVLFAGIRMTVLGMLIGLAGVFGTTRLIRSMLFEIKSYDSATLVMVVLTIAAAALVALLYPAYRASKLDPIQALHCQ